MDLVTSRRRSTPSHTEGKVWDLLVNGETTQVGFWPEAPLTRGRGLPGLIQSCFPPKNEELTEAPCRRGQLLWPPASLHAALPTRVSFPACSFFLSPLAPLGSLPSGLLRGAGVQLRAWALWWCCGSLPVPWLRETPSGAALLGAARLSPAFISSPVYFQSQCRAGAGAEVSKWPPCTGCAQWALGRPVYWGFLTWCCGNAAWDVPGSSGTVRCPPGFHLSLSPPKWRRFPS